MRDREAANKNTCKIDQNQNLTKAELPTLTELRVVSLVHVPGLTVQTLRTHIIKNINDDDNNNNNKKFGHCCDL